jgi:hypothetical protein
MKSNILITHLGQEERVKTEMNNLNKVKNLILDMLLLEVKMSLFRYRWM